MGTAGFRLQCVGCYATYDPPRLRCDRCDGLLRAVHSAEEFRPRSRSDLFAFLDWLPSTSAADIPIGTVVYPSKGLGSHLGLSRLSIAFSGYAPEIGAENPTGSFKDFEAAPSILYYREQGIESLVLASAGNTARAFAYAATRLDYPIIIVVPQRALDRVWIPCKASDAVRLVVLDRCDDYATAIRVAGAIGRVLGIADEGGARNVARRDGMSTVILEYAKQTGSPPSHYVQAIGSGTGAIAAWEASQRLLNAGVGRVLPTLHLAQNAPFTPVHNAWTSGVPIEPDVDVEAQLRRLKQIDAPVLANRMPPYDVPGGVRDALDSTSGRTYAATNAEAREAAALFEKTEGFSIGPAAAVAVAALAQAVATKGTQGDAEVLLHITGNNETLLKRDFALCEIEPVWRVDPALLSDATIEAARDRLRPPRQT